MRIAGGIEAALTTCLITLVRYVQFTCGEERFYCDFDIVFKGVACPSSYQSICMSVSPAKYIYVDVAPLKGGVLPLYDRMSRSLTVLLSGIFLNLFEIWMRMKVFRWMNELRSDD